MYSPDGRKEWYLEECRKSIYEESSVELLERIFTSTELEEKAFNKDVCDFTDAEVVDLFKSYDSKSRPRLKNTAWYLSKYRQWCYDKGLTKKIDDAFDDRTIDNIIKEVIPDSMLLNSYFTKKYLIETVEVDPDYINRMILLCPYYGIKGDDLEDIVNLKISDLDESAKKVSLFSGLVIEVDDYFIETMKNASNTTEYKQNSVRNHLNHKQQIYVKSGYIITRTSGFTGEAYDNKPVVPKFITNRLQKFKKEFDAENISISSLYKNGLINYITEKYKEQNISLKTALFYNDGIYKYDKETEEYIKAFGSKITVRMLRRQLKDVIDKL
jgi:hypothetical protein